MRSALDLIRTVYVFELRSALRDRNTVVYSLVVPFVLYPALIWGIAQWTQFQSGSLEKLVSRISFAGSELLPDLADRLRADERFFLVETETPDAAIASGEIDAHLSGEALGDRMVLHADFDLSQDRSTTARERIVEVADDYREEMLAARFADAGRNESATDIFRFEEENVASAEEMGRFILSMALPVMMVLMVSVGAMHPAVDVLAGEKERRTVESLLSVGTARSVLLAGKLLVVMTLSFSALVLNLIGMLFAFNHLLSLSGAGTEVQVALPIGAVPIILAAGMLLAALISATMIFLASFARTFREGQSYVSPFYVLLLVPAFAGTMPGIVLDLRTALVPVTNVVLLLRDALAGEVAVLPAVVTLATLAVCAAFAIWIAQKVYADERVLLGASDASLRSLPAILFRKKRGGEWA